MQLRTIDSGVKESTHERKAGKANREMSVFGKQGSQISYFGGRNRTSGAPAGIN